MMARSFPRAGVFTLGYHRSQVTEFFLAATRAYEAAGRRRAGDGAAPGEEFDDTTIRSVSFSLVRGGYEPAAVDRALDRLEQAFVKRRRAGTVARTGGGEWRSHVEELTDTLTGRLRRAPGERFAHPEGRTRGYDAREVDRLLDRVVAHLEDGAALTVTEVRDVRFAPARRVRAYDEAVVDAYLDRVIQVLLARS